MNRKILVISITAILALSMVLVGSADDEKAARTVPLDCINPGEEFIVTVELPKDGISGLVIEKLCDGWEYVDSSLNDYQVIDHTAVNNTLIFTLVGDKTFNYTVKAPDTSETSCEITGVFRNIDMVDYPIEKDPVCTCTSGVTLPILVRTVPADCIDPDTQFTVTVESPGTGVVTETLCNDWTYVSSSLDACQVTTDGNAVTFTLENDASFTYTVQAPDTENVSCTIQGIFSIDNVDHNFIDDSVCTCSGTLPTLVRTVPTDCIDPNTQFTVTVETPGTGVVTETLCNDWTYVSSSLDACQVTTDGNAVTFTLENDASFTYTVQAPDTENVCCTIQGIFSGTDNVDHNFINDSVCTRESGVTPPTLVRTVPADCIDPNTQFTVTVESPGTGAVIETLCDDWTYVSSSLETYQVSVDGNTITFTIVNDTSFTYTVQAPDTEDVSCTIQGIFKDMDKVEHDFIDDSVCTCVDIQPTDTTPEPTEIPEFPTLILPITAILGLMFLLARKK
jgi:uncharacterized protein YfcZ (UPF0381/DUF406 family)